jgi:hypothetical protein
MATAGRCSPELADRTSPGDLLLDTAGLILAEFQTNKLVVSASVLPAANIKQRAWALSVCSN